MGQTLRAAIRFESEEVQLDASGRVVRVEPLGARTGVAVQLDEAHQVLRRPFTSRDG